MFSISAAYMMDGDNVVPGSPSRVIPTALPVFMSTGATEGVGFRNDGSVVNYVNAIRSTLQTSKGSRFGLLRPPSGLRAAARRAGYARRAVPRRSYARATVRRRVPVRYASRRRSYVPRRRAYGYSRYGRRRY